MRAWAARSEGRVLQGMGEEVSKKEGKTKRTHGKQCGNCRERGGGGGRGNRRDKW